MSWVAVAVGGGTALQMGGSLFGGLMGASSEKKRAAAIREAGTQGASAILKYGKAANEQIDKQLGVARGDLSPFRDMGVEAGNTLTDLLMGRRTTSGMLKASDLFNFQSELGTRQIDRSLSARGLYGSGAGLEALSRFNAQLVGEEGQRLTDRLFGLTQLGQNSASTIGQMTNNAGIQQGGNILNSGSQAATMRYNSTVGAAQAQANAGQMIAGMGQNMFNQAGSGLMQYGGAMAQQPATNQSMQLTDMLMKGFGGGMTGGSGGGSGGGNSGNRFGFTSML